MEPFSIGKLLDKIEQDDFSITKREALELYEITNSPNDNLHYDWTGSTVTIKGLNVIMHITKTEGETND